ncbi:MAG TPA: hypothetical protein DF296_05705 [Candidatus Margulisbacteria bacterium]|nr:MAG: hypothetical protein A2X43_04355 [Candidatus Margulisbacteria bacterium GWD2_39_127]OGI04059.1 MAG: hypothetical protein A2X42_11145 [Candidatus Margulisbacteria bacterium GWF2_38_17]OGI06002.1 MAG: hypothetical protein A2X41_12320 [Candidatus Margulisbacteria bacterium GWE2_39_32]HAR63406.1 hypothetical protein [Candidatus Margulisiibacteriota bacterium]HCT84676.1 hypothetical protein [Candidatus Margulisiibacteriota bacterium]
MEKLGLRKKMIINTISNYITIIIKILIMLFLARTIFLGITREEYGFWALLWSVFGYSLLLDFGFGTTIQKYTSELTINHNWDEYNQLISTFFFNYCLMSLLIVIVTVILSYFLNNIFNFQNTDNIHYYKTICLMFGIGTAVVFPFGFFAEILRGLQKINLRNIIQLTFLIINFILMIAVIYSGFSLKGMTIVSVTTSLLTNLVMGYFCYKSIPQLKISLKHYNRHLIKDIMSFSLFAYLIIFSNMIIFKTDQIVISVFSSVAFVALYQIAARISDTYKYFSTQFLDNLGPVAAKLYTSNQKEKLAEIMIQSNRLLTAISTLILIPLLVYIKPILFIWLKLSDHTAAICSAILLVSMFIMVILRSSSVQVLIMSDEHKSLTKVAIIECTANLLLSIILIRYIGIIGVAIGTIIPNAVLAFVYNVPKACKFANVSLWKYVKESFGSAIAIGMIVILIAYQLYRFHYPDTIFLLFLYSSLVSITYLILYYIIGAHKWEKAQLHNYIKEKLLPNLVRSGL